MQKDLNKLEKKYKDFIKEFMNIRFDNFEKAVNTNLTFLLKVVENHKNIFYWRELENGERVLPPLIIKPQNISKLRSTIRQIARDWTSAGQEERNQCYGPLIELIEDHFKNTKERNKISILCPVRINLKRDLV